MPITQIAVQTSTEGTPNQRCGPLTNGSKGVARNPTIGTDAMASYRGLPDDLQPDGQPVGGEPGGY